MHSKTPGLICLMHALCLHTQLQQAGPQAAVPLLFHPHELRLPARAPSHPHELLLPLPAVGDGL